MMSEKSYSELQVSILPESLAEIVESLQSKGYTEEQITEEVAKIQASIQRQVEDQLENGDLDLDELESIDDNPTTIYSKRLH